MLVRWRICCAHGKRLADSVCARRGRGVEGSIYLRQRIDGGRRGLSPVAAAALACINGVGAALCGGRAGVGHGGMASLGTAGCECTSWWWPWWPWWPS